MNTIAKFAALAAIPAAMLSVQGQAHGGHADARFAAEAEAELPQVRTAPIAGVFDKRWYNYLADINEAEKELQSDMRRATDREDREDAQEEYWTELADADHDYVKAMRKRGYRAGRVTIVASRD